MEPKKNIWIEHSVTKILVVKVREKNNSENKFLFIFLCFF